MITILLLPINAFAEKVVFVSLDNLPPKVYQEDGQLKGIYIDVIREVCKRLNIEPEFQLYPWKRCVRMVQNGKADAIFPPFFTEERGEFLYFPSEPMSFTRNVIFALKTRNIKVKNFDELKGLIVGVNSEYSYGSEFDSYKNNLNLEYCGDEETQIKKLAVESPKRMDAAIASEEPFKFLSKQLGFSDKFEVIYVLSEKPSYVAFSKATGEKSKLLSEKFSTILSNLREEGIVQQIEDNYLK